MEKHKVSNLLNDSTVSNDSTFQKFVTRKWIEVHDSSNSQYSVHINIRFKTPMLRSDSFDYSDAYTVVKGTIEILAAAANANDKAAKDVAFKDNSPFSSCISNINNTLPENSEDLDIVMPMYNLLEYGHNYSMTTGSLWNYYRDEMDEAAVNGKSFEHKTKTKQEIRQKYCRNLKRMETPTNNHDHQYQP